MTAFVELQQKEFAAAERGFTAVKHQREVGTGYFDDVTQVIQAGKSSVTALTGSTEEEQFYPTATPIAPARSEQAAAAD
jgi:isocitrate lyase